MRCKLWYRLSIFYNTFLDTFGEISNNAVLCGMDSSGNANNLGLTLNFRPVFLLPNDMKIISGNGSIDSPYYIE